MHHGPAARARALDATLRARLEAASSSGTTARRLGVEHEYAAFAGERQVDFREHVHALGLPGRRIHPTQEHLYLTPSGLAVMADGIVAETVSPPERLRRGSPAALAAWGAAGRALLEAHAGALRLVPGSTHLSVEVHPAHADALALWHAQTFGPALMLLVDNVDSPGHLIRPLPGASNSAASSSKATGCALQPRSSPAPCSHSSRRALPPAVQVSLEPARQRFGWYIDRTAFGDDLYATGRASVLRLRTGGAMSAQKHLEACWEVARAALRGSVDDDDVTLVERTIAGTIPLPCEDGTWRGSERSPLPPPHAFGRLVGMRSEMTLTPVTATWDFVAFRLAADDHECVVNVPEARLVAFLDLAEAGALDDLFESALTQPSTTLLAARAQTAQPAFFAGVTPSDALLPRDRVGVGAGPVSTVRPGKIETPPPPPPITHTGGHLPWPWLLAGLIALLARGRSAVR